MEERNATASAADITQYLKERRDGAAIIRDSASCLALLVQHGLLHEFSDSEESGLAAVIVDSVSHYIIVGRWREHSHDEKVFYQAYCAPKSAVTEKECLNIIHWMRYFSARPSKP